MGLIAAITLTTAIPDRSAAAPPEVRAETSTSTTTTSPPTTAVATTATTQPPPTTIPEVVEPIVIGPIQPDTALQLSAGALSPDPLDARADLPAVYGDGCHQNQQDAAVLSCTYGDSSSQTQVVIVGDSHAAMWVPPLRSIADEQGWEIRTITKSNCQLADTVIANGEQLHPYDNCVAWNEAAIEQLATTRPDLVLVAGRFWPTLVGDDGLVDGLAREEALAGGLETAWTRLTAADLNVVTIQDVPYPVFDVAECVSENLDNLAACAMDRTVVMAENTPHAVAAAATGIGIIDLTDQICFEGLCPSVIDNVLVWRDTHHLTATYARLLAEGFAAQLREIAPSIFAEEPAG